MSSLSSGTIRDETVSVTAVRHGDASCDQGAEDQEVSKDLNVSGALKLDRHRLSGPSKSSELLWTD